MTTARRAGQLSPLPIHRTDDRHRVTVAWRGRFPRWGLTLGAARATDVLALPTDHNHVDHRLAEQEARWILDRRSRLSGANVEIL
jgi:hypothetical protein